MTFATRSLTAILIILLTTSVVFSTTPISSPTTYEVKRVYKPLSISKSKLANAKSIADLNKHYKADWVSEYKSVIITACIDGVTMKEEGKDDVLTSDQMKLMANADAGTDISISTVYLPDNNLKSNDIHEMGFTFMVNPELNAEFPGGENELNAYIDKNVKEKLVDLDLRPYQLAVVKFTIAKDGSIQNSSIFSSSEDDESDSILLKAVENMPKWKPAQYVDGTLITQEYALTVGDNQSCTSNLLNLEEN